MGLILLQSKGAGLGSIFGGNESVFTTRRGIERLLFQFTIGASAAFLVFSLLVAKFACRAGLRRQYSRRSGRIGRHAVFRAQWASPVKVLVSPSAPHPSPDFS